MASSSGRPQHLDAARPPPATGGMAPPAASRPDVLPTADLTEIGRLQPGLREQFRRVPGFRNALTLVSVWLQAAVILTVAAWLAHPLAWLVAFALMTRVIVLASILSHEAAHRLLFTRKSLNDFAGRWLLSYPVFVPFDAYRRAHMAHHREAFGPNEPDMILYANYPISRSSMRRKLARDISGISGLKLLRGLFRSLRGASSRPVALSILAVQAVLWTITWVAFGWWVYPLMWLLPWLTTWRVLARLRAISEHGGMRRSADEREVTHHVRQHVLARFWMVPYNTGWHLAHHVDPGLSFRLLPRFHSYLSDSGWLPETLVHRSYPALWAKLVSRAGDRG